MFLKLRDIENTPVPMLFFLGVVTEEMRSGVFSTAWLIELENKAVTIFLK